MEEGPTRQGFIFSRDSPVYHLAANGSLSLSGLWVHGEPEQRRRRNDRQLATKQPEGQLCSACDRKASGKPESKNPSPELLSPSCYIDIII